MLSNAEPRDSLITHVRNGKLWKKQAGGGIISKCGAGKQQKHRECPTGVPDA